MKRLGLWSCLLLLAMTSLVYARHDGSYMHEMSMEYETPHLTWGKPLAGGSIKALLVTPRKLAAREIIELAQRLDMDWRGVAIFRADHIAWDSIYEAAVTGTSRQEKTEELLGQLRQPAEVIVLGNVVLNSLPIEAKYRVIQHVADGGGLVITYPRRHPYRKLYANPTKDNESIVSLVSQDGLTPALRDKPIDQWVKTYEVGKGRIVEITYPTTHSAHYGGLGLTYETPAVTGEWFAHYEANMALVARAVRWAAGRAERVTLDVPALAQTAVFTQDKLKDSPLSITVRSQAVSSGKLTLRLRADNNDILWTHEQSVTLQNGQAEVAIALPVVRSGLHTLDLIFTSGQGVETFGYRTLRVVSPLGQPAIRTDKEVYEPGQTVKVTVQATRAAAAPLQVRLSLADMPHGRVWEFTEAAWPQGQRSVTVDLPVRQVPTIAGEVIAEVRQGDVVLDRVSTEVFFPKREKEIYTEYSWNSIAGYLAPFMAAREVDDAKWTSGLTHPSAGGSNAREMAIYNQQFIPYLTRVGIGSDKDGKTLNNFFLGLSKKEIDEAGIADDQSFYNPKVQALWKQALDKRMENLPKYGPLVYNLGDENYVSYDGGYAPSDLPAYRAYLAKRYGSIDKLNQQWETSFASFDVVEHLPMDQLRQNQRFAQWFDHRRFMEQQYADVHHFLADYIRTIDPHAHVGAEGSVPGDLEKTIQGLEFWGPYSRPLEDELLRSIGSDKLRTLWWGGYTGSHGGRNNYPMPLWIPLVQGVVNGNAWYTAGVSTDGFLGVDLTWAEYYKHLMPHLEHLRRGVAQMLITQPLRKDGVAILFSHASQSVSLMDPRLFSPSDSTGPLMRYLYRTGVSFDFVTSSMVEKGELAQGGYRILFLNGATALSQAEADAIRAFAQQGGLVVADINPGVLNEYAGKLATSSLADFFGVPELNWQPELAMDKVAVNANLRGQTIRFDAAKAWQTPGLPIFKITPAGKGHAVLLNFNLGSAQNSASSEAAFAGLLGGLLKAAQVSPAVRIAIDGRDSTEFPNLLARVREQGNSQSIAIVADAADIGKKLTLTFGKPVHAFVTDGKPLGRNTTFTLTLDSPFVMVSAFDSEPASPTLKLDRTRIELGDIVKLDVSPLDGAAVYRLEVIAPDGKLLDRRTRVFTRDQLQQADRIAFAYTDKPGSYTVKLTDVRTGLAKDQKVEVAK